MSKYSDMMAELNKGELDLDTSLAYRNIDAVLRERVDLLSGILRTLLEELAADEEGRRTAEAHK